MVAARDCRMPHPGRAPRWRWATECAGRAPPGRVPVVPGGRFQAGRPAGRPRGACGWREDRVADIRAAYADWSAKGAEFLTEPKDHGREIRAYIRDPDGHW